MTGSELTRQLREAYGAGAAAWASGPVRMYRALADVLVAQAPDSIRDRVVLDLGAGTGAASDAALAAGARAVVAADLAEGMLRYSQRERPPALVADGSALALRDGCVDAVVAACCINHAPEPVTMAAEARRVTRAGRVTLMSTFVEGTDHPSKAIIDGVLTGFGYSPPPWYVEAKESIIPLTATAEALEHTARTAGFTEIEVRDLQVDTGLRTAPELASWRLGMAAQGAFFSRLPEVEQDAVLTAVVDSMGSDPPPLVARLLVLAAAG
ncbi:MAG: class I SAM-dependent methyltransferase [Acidimicrobiia bacterium]